MSIVKQIVELIIPKREMFMNKKDNQRVRLTKQLLRESLIRLLREKPLYEITVSQLCTESEINRSTFYKHYGNVRDIYEEIEQEVITKSEQCIQAVNSLEKESVLLPLEQLLLYIQQHADLYKLLMQNSADGEFSYKLIRDAMDFVHRIPQLLREEWEGQEEYCFSYIISGSIAVIQKWIQGGAEESPYEIASLIYSLAVDLLQIPNKRS